MAVVKVRNLWTAFITAFFAVLATLGLTTPATAAAGSADQPADQPADQRAETAAPAPAVPVPVPAPRIDSGGAAARATGAGDRRRVPEQVSAAREPRDRALPPTIKQRITAEAHGSSPSVRRIPAETPLDGQLDELGDVALTAA
ncbi:DUF6344 domain-containing protein [Streptomyces sp. 8L]|uniref:DUF6344 domain-containing protein n=1 Tax=Streptomyces sp. 8L TaxID=2877242 RepID=UPI001CD49C80|nr:DUF6344 domain-containing protein [Streptomyces sp. 8L]MCA1222750.1 DUF6344 domain-containing protein [Streptomyces sp. 8L]